MIDSPTTEKSKSAPSRFRKFLRGTERFFAIIGLVFVIYRSSIELIVMTSGSMSPTLQGDSYENGDRIILEKISRHFRKPKRWEIYFFYEPDGTPVAKRVVGLPGEKVLIKGNQIFINGSELNQPEVIKDIKYFGYGNLAAGRQVDCGADYYMLGDDSSDSYDSRYIGPVSAAGFRGRVCCIVWPPSRIGFVK